MKNTYQTCLRLSETLKDEMTTICDSYQINKLDFMRRDCLESLGDMCKP